MNEREQANKRRQADAKEHKKGLEEKRKFYKLEGNKKTGKLIEVRELTNGNKYRRYVGKLKDKACMAFFGKLECTDAADGLYKLKSKRG